MKLKVIFVTLAILVMITSCTSTQNLSLNDKQRIKKIYVDKNIKRASEMYYYGPELRTGGLFGAVGSVFAAALKPGEKIEECALKNDIYIEKIFYQKLYDKLKMAHHYKLVNNEDEADAVIKIDIQVYGFSVSPGFESYRKIVPYLVVKCEMYDGIGNRIWESSDKTSIFSNSNPAVPFDPDDIYENPNLINQAWEAASKEVAKNIILDL